MKDSSTMLSAGSELLRAIRVHFPDPPIFTLEEMRSRRWSSPTFVGGRHELTFRLDGDGADERAGRFLSDLHERNFDLRGHLLADLSLVSEERKPGSARIRLEALTVEDA